MPISRRLLLTSLPLFAVLPVRAEVKEEQQDKRTLFEQLFPKPTGTNGFEEIVQAGERLKATKVEYPPEREFTLTKKRAYVNDPAARAALSLVRRGVTKPITVPSDLLRVSQTLYRVSSLIMFRVEVGFADGDGAAAVADALAFLRFADSLRSVNIRVAALAGVLLETVSSSLVRLREVWSERNCIVLLRFANARALAPVPEVTALSADRKHSHAFWGQLRSKRERLHEYFYSLRQYESKAVEGTPDCEYWEARLAASPDLAAQVWREMRDAVDAYYDRVATFLSDPTQPDPYNTPSQEQTRFHVATLYLRDSLVVPFGGVLLTPVETRLTHQRLAIHAAIRAYRWEYDRLPKTLDELKLSANLTLDPYTAKPLLYEPDATPGATTYELYSAGALVPGKDGKPDTREPFHFPPKPRKP